MKFASPDDLPSPHGYSQVVTVPAGTQVWVSGQVASGPDGSTPVLVGAKSLSHRSPEPSAFTIHTFRPGQPWSFHRNASRRLSGDHTGDVGAVPIRLGSAATRSSASGVAAGCVLVVIMLWTMTARPMSMIDMASLLGLGAAMTIICTLAGLGPMRRALRVQPTDALHVEQ